MLKAVLCEKVQGAAKAINPLEDTITAQCNLYALGGGCVTPA